MRVLLADDRPEIRSALRLLLEQRAGLTVVGEAAEVGSLLQQARQLRPDLVLLDWELSDGAAPPRRDDPGRGSLVVALRSVCPKVAVVALSGRFEARHRALEAGADAFVSKSEPPENLLKAVSELLQTERRLR